MIIKKIYNSLNFIKNNSVEGLDQSFTWVIKDENNESKEIELILTTTYSILNLKTVQYFYD